MLSTGLVLTKRRADVGPTQRIVPWFTIGVSVTGIDQFGETNAFRPVQFADNVQMGFVGGGAAIKVVEGLYLLPQVRYAKSTVARTLSDEARTILGGETTFRYEVLTFGIGLEFNVR